MATIKQPIGRVQGERGETGPRNEVVGSVYRFTASDSPTTPPTAAEWLPVPPLEEQGKYIWCRSTITWQDGPDTTIYSVGYNGRDGAFNGQELVKAIEARVQELEDRVTPVSKGGLGTTTIEGAKAKLGIPEIISTLDNTQSAGVNLLRGTRDFHIGTENTGYPNDLKWDGIYFSNDKWRVVSASNPNEFAEIERIPTGTSGHVYFNPVLREAVNGKFVTFSFEIMFLEKPQLNSTLCQIQKRSTVNTSLDQNIAAPAIDLCLGTSFDNVETGVWYKVTYVYKHPISLDEGEFLRVGIFGSATDVRKRIRKVKFEIDEVHNPTWSPSPFDAVQQSDARVLRQVQQGTGQSVAGYSWLGRNLEELHKDLIGNQEPIKWLDSIAKAGTFNNYDIQVGDYLTCPLNDPFETQYIYQIGAFDLYYATGSGTSSNGHMITLVPLRPYSAAMPFNAEATNQGKEDNQSPWKASDLYAWCNETFYDWLPQSWKDSCLNVSYLNPIRYSPSTKLVNDSGAEWGTLGKVWVPSEMEVWGCVRRGSLDNSNTAICITDHQIPLFATHAIRNRVSYWLRTVLSSSTTYVCYVGNNGTCNGTSSTGSGIYPLPCLHIG